MENQVNVGDQNTQQIGQNPINQPIQITRRSKVPYWIIAAFVLVVLLIFGSLYVLNLQKQGNPTTTPPIKSQTSEENQLLKQLLDTSAPSWGSSTWVKPVSEELSNKYLSLWEEIFKNKNNISDSYFNKHIKVIYKGATNTLRTWDKETRTKGREYFIIVANYSIDWLSVNFVDELVIKQSDSSSLLSTESIKNNPESQEIHGLKPISGLSYNFGDVIRYVEGNKPKNGELRYQYFTLLTDQDMIFRGASEIHRGGIFLFLNGFTDKSEKECIDLLVNVTTLQTAQYNQHPCIKEF